MQALIDACGEQVLDVLATGGQARDAYLVRLGVPPDFDPESKRVWVLERGDRMIGLVEGLMHHPQPGECLIRVFAVHPDARGQGLAGAASRALLERARTHGVTAIAVVHRREDEVTRSMLRSLGFQLDAESTDAGPEELYGAAVPRGFAVTRLVMEE